MTLNFNAAGQRVDAGREQMPVIKSVPLDFQPVIVSGGHIIAYPPPQTDVSVKITIDPTKITK